jgi:hypothetical protein
MAERPTEARHPNSDGLRVAGLLDARTSGVVRPATLAAQAESPDGAAATGKAHDGANATGGGARIP